jgi:hypothetical protein
VRRVTIRSAATPGRPDHLKLSDDLADRLFFLDLFGDELLQFGHRSEDLPLNAVRGRRSGG